MDGQISMQILIPIIAIKFSKKLNVQFQKGVQKSSTGTGGSKCQSLKSEKNHFVIR